MTFAWRTAGLSYVKYAEAGAQALRNGLKEDLRVQVARRNENNLKYARWQDGKIAESKFIVPPKEI